MFKIRDGVIITDEADRINDAGLMVVVEHYSNNIVMFVCRNLGNKVCAWQFSPKNQYWFDNRGISTAEKLFELLKTDYPDDLIWLLFHPEIYDGRYDG